jgi:hypothetical protein
MYVIDKPVSLALMYVGCAIFVGAQTIPARALVRRVMSWRTKKAAMRASYAIELARWARLIDTNARESVVKGQDESAVLAEYERAMRPKIQDLYDAVRRHGCGCATTAHLIGRVSNVADLNALGAALQSMSRRMGSSPSNTRKERT